MNSQCRKAFPDHRIGFNSLWRVPKAAAIASILAGLFPPGPATMARLHAQVVVRHEITCPACTIEFSKVVALGGADTLSLLHSATSLDRDSRGRYYAIGFTRTHLVVFDSSGRYVRRVGHAGDGPGEVSGSIQRFLVGPGDSIYVFDARRRLIVFSPAYEHVSTVPLPWSPAAAFIVGRNVTVSAAGNSRSAGPLFHHVSSDGMVTHSFGEVAARPPIRSQDLMFVPASDSRSIWKWSGREYRFERISTDGRVVQQVEVSGVPWLNVTTVAQPKLTPLQQLRLLSDTAARRELANASGGNPGHLVLSGQDASGRLWIVGSRSSAHVLSSKQEGAQVIEVFDITSAKLLLSVPSSRSIVFLARSDLVYDRTTSGEGVVTLTVWRTRLNGL